ncbi:MAG TPA: response regulator transcription factor [Catenuloplanes sp.]|jgi:two-component system nitrate/nitrite response regulator NarL
MVSAVICDDHRLFGESFAHALRGGGATVTVTSSPQEALAVMEVDPVDRVVINALFRTGPGFATIRRIRDTWPQAHVACVGADDPGQLRGALDAGAHTFLSKKRPLPELVDAVLRASLIARTGGCIRPTVTGQRLPGQRLPVGSEAGTYPPARSDYPLAAQFLTNREREVLQLLVSAKSTDRIADELGISVTTTRGYVQSILEKFGVHSRIEAVTYAVRHAVIV